MEEVRLVATMIMIPMDGLTHHGMEVEHQLQRFDFGLTQMIRAS